MGVIDNCLVQSKRGAQGIFEFCKHIAALLPDCSGPSPLDPNNPNLDITKNLPSMKKVLKKVSETELGTHLCYPGAAEIDAMSETDTRKQLGFLRNFDGLASFILRLFATMEGELTTCMSENPGRSVIHHQGHASLGSHLLPASTQQASQGTTRHGATPQGKTHQQVKRSADDPHFTLWDLCPILDAVTTEVTSIVVKATGNC